jgi:hypothetical protein
VEILTAVTGIAKKHGLYNLIGMNEMTDFQQYYTNHQQLPTHLWKKSSVGDAADMPEMLKL